MLTIEVEPWPLYSEVTLSAAWRVRVSTPKHSAWLVWSTRFGRFTDSKSIISFRRGEPQMFREAIEFMRDFCSKKGQVYDSDVTQKTEEVTEGCDETGRNSVTVSRAQELLRSGVTVSHGTGAVTVTHACDAGRCDSDTPRLGAGGVTITPSKHSLSGKMSAWVAAMPLSLGTSEDPAVALVLAERTELMRRAALAAIGRADAGQSVDPHYVAWARQFVAANPARVQALGSGDPSMPVDSARAPVLGGAS